MKHKHKKTNSIQLEIEWFTRVLDHQFQTYFNPSQQEASGDLPVAPDLSHNRDHYSHIVTEYELNIPERIVLMLALMPHLKPNLLDIFFTKNAHFDRTFTEFGGYAGKTHAGFLPTGETASFILYHSDIDRRAAVVKMFSPEHVFANRQILRLESAEHHEPFLSGRLIIDPDFLDYLIGGKRIVPTPSESFPARKIKTDLEWDDLILNDAVREGVQEIRTWIEHSHNLMHCTIFRKHVKPGFRTLFYGPPGTGKTLTACLIGKVTGLDVYRVDLSLVVSKYIGETEKNLARIFDLAKKRSWILFFDEADALFGKRTQTHSSNDRYANQEVSYLLQRIEDFPGVIILASNLKSNIDEAFSRRFQSIIYFPMPDKHQRLTLWKQFFSGTLQPATDVDLMMLADNYELSGGSAINIFRYSALKAIERNSHEVTSDDVLQGIRKEYQKYGRTI